MRQIKRVAATLASSAVILTTMTVTSAHAAPLPGIGTGIGQNLNLLTAILAFVRRTLA